MTKLCVRCGEEKEMSQVATQLVHPVCDYCRLDRAGWEFNGTRIVDMEYQSTEPGSVIQAREDKNENQKYS